MDFLVSKISRQKSGELIRQYQTNARTLEIGSFGSPSYARYFPNKIGVDIRPGNGVDVVANVYNLPFKEGEFDVVLCMTVLEHLEDPTRAIKEMRRVLKVGGRIIVSVPFMFPMHDVPGDYWRFTKFGLQKLFSEGWIIEKLLAETTTQEAFAVLLQRLGYQTKMRLNGLLKLFTFTLARVLEKMPNMIKTVYGEIGKKTREPEAFTSGFFLVARKSG